MLTGVILAGGRSRFLNGQLKSMLPVGGERLILSQVRRMMPICDELIVVTNDPLPLLKIVDSSVRVITDFIPNKGPLSGLHAGLSLCEHPNAWVVACDMPNVSAEAAKLMLDRKNQLGCDAILPVIGCNTHLLHSVFHKSCVDAISALLHTDKPEWTDMLRMMYWEGIQDNDFEQNQVATDFVFRIETEEDYERAQAAVL